MPSTVRETTKTERLKRGPRFQPHADRKTDIVNWLMDVCLGMNVQAACRLCDQHCVKWVILKREGIRKANPTVVRGGNIGGGRGNALGFETEANLVVACVRLQ